MSDQKLVALPVWRSSRRTGLLLVVLGTLVTLFGMGLYLDSVDLEAELEELASAPPPPAPPASTSNPPTTPS